MKKLFIAVLALCLVVPFAVSAETTKPLKCKFPAGTNGIVIMAQHGALVEFKLAESVTITVLETLSDEFENEDGTKEEVKLYRFSADYDKPVLACPTHGKHTFEEYGSQFPQEALNEFYLDAALATECK